VETYVSQNASTLTTRRLFKLLQIRSGFPILYGLTFRLYIISLVKVKVIVNNCLGEVRKKLYKKKKGYPQSKCW